MNVSKLKTNRTLEEKGKWFPMEDAEFLIASTGGAAYRKAIVDAGRQMGPLRKLKTEEQTTDAVLDVVAEHILLGWRGNVTHGEDETPLEPTLENRKMLLRELRPFLDWVSNIADDFSQFLDESTAGAAKIAGES